MNRTILFTNKQIDILQQALTHIPTKDAEDISKILESKRLKPRDYTKSSHLYREKTQTTQLNEENVREIFYSRDTYQVLAERYGVSPTAIGNVRNKKSWKHITRTL